jgi:LemA protein
VGNELDETVGPVNPGGRDVNVIDKQLKVEIGAGTRIFELSLWVVGVLAALGVALAVKAEPVVVVLITLAGLIPGLIFQLMKTNALAYLRKLQQKIQADASQIDNYLEQRVVILRNLADLVAKSIDLDKDVMKSVAAYRSGFAPTGDEARNQMASALDGAFSRINVAFEAYPELRAQSNIAEAIRQNAYLQKEITAARTLYNDTVATWNQDIFAWPTKQIVAARAGYTTRIPFTASQETKMAARGRFFDA